MLENFDLKIGERDSECTHSFREGVGTYSDMKIYSWKKAKKVSEELLVLELVFPEPEKGGTRKLTVRKEYLLLLNCFFP